jgi:hypothetical protein
VLPKQATDGATYVEGTVRWNKYRLNPPQERKQIGYVDVKTNWRGAASDDEYFRWRVSFHGVRISEGEEKIPLQSLKSRR